MSPIPLTHPQPSQHILSSAEQKKCTCMACFSVWSLHCPQHLPVAFQRDSGAFWPLPLLHCVETRERGLLCLVEAVRPMFWCDSGLFYPPLPTMSPAHPTRLPPPLAYVRHPHPPIAPAIHEKRDTRRIFHGWHTPHTPPHPTNHTSPSTQPFLSAGFSGWLPSPSIPQALLHSKTRNTPPWEPEPQPIGAMFLVSLAPPSSPTPSPTCHSERIPLETAQNWWVTVKYCQGFTLADDSRHYFFILAIPSIFTSVSNSPLLQFLLKFWLQNTFLPPIRQIEILPCPSLPLFLSEEWLRKSECNSKDFNWDRLPSTLQSTHSLRAWTISLILLIEGTPAERQRKYDFWFACNWPSSICNHLNPPTLRLSHIHLSILLSSLLLLLVAEINICSICPSLYFLFSFLRASTYSFKIITQILNKYMDCQVWDSQFKNRTFPNLKVEHMPTKNSSLEKLGN